MNKIFMNFGFQGIYLLVAYFFCAKAVYTISKNRGYQYPWLSYIPFANSWMIGSIADSIHACYGKRTRYRVILISTALVPFAALIMLVIITVLYSTRYNHYGIEMMFLPIIPSIVMLIALILNYVMYMICLNTVFKDYIPDQSVLFLILSIIFGIQAFFLYAIRNNSSQSLAYQNYCRNMQSRPNASSPFTYR